MLYSGAGPEWGKIGYLVVVSLASFAIGWTIFTRLSRRVAEEL